MDEAQPSGAKDTPHPVHSQARFRGTFMLKALPARIVYALMAMTIGAIAQAQQQLEAKISPVTDAVLANPPPQDWLMWRRTLDSWGYSPLKQVNADNVQRLQLVWTRGLEPGPQEGT